MGTKTSRCSTLSSRTLEEFKIWSPTVRLHLLRRLERGLRDLLPDPTRGGMKQIVNDSGAGRFEVRVGRGLVSV
jgi:hypothetical protein